jgi:metallo-beta-lactamase family protein
VKRKVFASQEISEEKIILLVDPAKELPQTDYVVCETTYGARLHEDKVIPEDALARLFNELVSICQDV